MKLVIINSQIYTDLPSVFAPSERLNQLVNSIRSIKNTVPDSEIHVIECSDITTLDQRKIESVGRCSVYQATVRDGTDASREIASIAEFASTLENKKYDGVIKLAGRYCITPLYSAVDDKWNVRIFKRYGREWMSTMLYTCPDFEQWKRIMMSIPVDTDSEVTILSTLRELDIPIRESRIVGAMGMIARTAELSMH